MFWDNAIPIMEKKRISQRDLAQITDRPFSTVHSWIKRKCPPQADDALKIADLLGVSVRYLVTGEDEEGLTPRERELLDVCRLLPDRKFSIVLKNAQAIKEEMETESETGLSSRDLEEISGK